MVKSKRELGLEAELKNVTSRMYMFKQRLMESQQTNDDLRRELREIASALKVLDFYKGRYGHGN